MGIDGMRVGGGRCPPLIVAGLIVACFLLVCNWWSLSTENNELLRQIDGLSQQLKLSAEQSDQCMTLRSSFEQRYKNAEVEIASLHVQLGQERDSEKRLDDTASMCKIELDSLRKVDFTKNATLETLRVEKMSINSQLEERKDENKKLQDELEKVRDELEKLKLSQDSTANKQKAAETQGTGTETNDTHNGGNQEDQDDADANQQFEEAMQPDNLGEEQEPDQDSVRDQEHMKHATSSDVKETK